MKIKRGAPGAVLVKDIPLPHVKMHTLKKQLS